MVKSLFLAACFIITILPEKIAGTKNSGYILVGNDSLYYEIAGSGDVIVFLHDGLLPCDVWDAQFDYFSKDHKVVRYDRRGYGRSSPATDTWSDLEDLRTVLSDLGIEKATLVGASSGGRLAIDFTLAHPQKITSLVLVGGVVGGLPYSKHFISRGGHLPSDLKDESQIVMYYAAEDPYEIWNENKAARTRAIELVKSYPVRMTGQRIRDSQKVPAYKRLNEITVPALILAGEFDIPDVHAQAGAMKAGIPDSKRVIIPRSGHLIPLEQPDLFNEELRIFLIK
jgi:3-oxoadipate enol-lactonase